MLAGRLRSSTPSAAGGDPFYASVSTLLKFEETAGSTSFTDSGPTSHTYSVNGGQVVASSLYGIGSWEMNAVAEYSITPVSSEFTLDAEFTIEFSCLHPSGATSSTGYDIIGGCHNDGSGTNGYFIEVGRQRGILIAAAGTTFVAYASFNPNDGVKHDYCIERNSSNLVRVYIDGAQVASTTNSATLSGATHGFRIGSNTVHWPVTTLDELRITKGVARYDSTSYTLGQPFPTS